MTKTQYGRTRYGVIAGSLNPDPRESVKRSRAIGFTGLLFDAYGASLNLTELSDTGRREFRHMLSTQGQALIGLRADLGPRGMGPGADLDRMLSKFDDVLQVAANLRSEVVCIDLGPLPAAVEVAPARPQISPELAGVIILPTAAERSGQRSAGASASAAPTSPPEDPMFQSQVHDALSALGALADRYRITVAFSTTLASFASLDRALTDVRCPWFGIDLDPVAVLRDRWNTDEIFTRVGPLVRHVRARDAVLGADHRTKVVEVGQGSVNWPAFLSALGASDYSSWITIDPAELPDEPVAAAHALKTLAGFDIDG